MQVIIRHATLRDADACADIYLASRKTFVAFAPLAHSDLEVRQWITETLIPAGGVFVAENAGHLLGMMALRREGALGWIDQLYLHPSSVRRGLGSRLLAHAHKELGSPIRLFTFQANLASRRFYERHGFHAIAFSDGHANEERCPDVLYQFDIGRSHTQPDHRVGDVIVED